MNVWCLGFVFHPVQGADFHTAEVLLITKDHPDWQKGRLNGVGGRVEPAEHPRDAMSRELLEESGYFKPRENWLLVARLTAEEEGLIYVYTAWEEPRWSRFPPLMDPKTRTGTHPTEPVYWMPAAHLPPTITIPNLRWLVPLCWDRLTGHHKYKVQST